MMTSFFSSTAVFAPSRWRCIEHSGCQLYQIKPRAHKGRSGCVCSVWWLWGCACLNRYPSSTRAEWGPRATRWWYNSHTQVSKRFKTHTILRMTKQVLFLFADYCFRGARNLGGCYFSLAATRLSQQREF